MSLVDSPSAVVGSIPRPAFPYNLSVAPGEKASEKSPGQRGVYFGSLWEEVARCLLQVHRSCCQSRAPGGRPLLVDLDVAEESPSPNLNLGTFAGFHVDTLIPKERGSAGGHAGARRNAQLDISC
jgi:hypothetical protein